MKFISRALLLLLATAMLLGFASCNRTVSGSKLTADNYDKITTGMAKSQVESILGPPATIDTKDFLVLKKTTYRYEDGSRFAMITFKNDEVDSKDSNLHQ